MIAKRGAKRRWHFAHKPPFDRCDPDNALHETAKGVIVQGFNEALAQSSEYRLGCHCSQCEENLLSRNVALPGATVDPELTIVEGTRSDLVFNIGVSNQVIVEIVVTHDLEPQTRKAYEQSGIPVLTVKPAWDDLEGLRTTIFAADTLNTGRRQCRQCKEQAKEAARQLEQDRVRIAAEARQREQKRRQVASDLARLDERSPVKCPFTPWTYDKFGRQMFPHIRAQVFASAIVLAELGFIQAREKPWLFYYKTTWGPIFADFGSTEDIAIWEDPSALIHWRLKCPDELEALVVEAALTKCRDAGASVRTSFYISSFDTAPNTEQIHPIEQVSKECLADLMKEASRNEAEERRQVESKLAAERKRLELERQDQVETEGLGFERQPESSEKKLLDDVSPGAACTKTESCRLEAGHDGNCVLRMPSILERWS